MLQHLLLIFRILAHIKPFSQHTSSKMNWFWPEDYWGSLPAPCLKHIGVKSFELESDMNENCWPDVRWKYELLALLLSSRKYFRLAVVSLSFTTAFTFSEFTLVCLCYLNDETSDIRYRERRGQIKLLWSSPQLCCCVQSAIQTKIG